MLMTWWTRRIEGFVPEPGGSALGWLGLGWLGDASGGTRQLVA